MRDNNVPVALCVAALGISESTVRRCQHEKPPRQPRAVKHCDAAKGRVRALVRESHGLIGAANLGRECGLPRRVCATVKKLELREMEYERKEQCASVRIAAPGIVRGFDAMHLEATDGPAYWLVAADAAIPYRTSIVTVPAYDAEHVIRALAADFEEHGRPLVIRLDRIACQRTAEVEAFLEDQQVLALHGPPRYPRFYGQLERQNRDHRGWWALHPPVTLRELAAAGCRMKTTLNTKWPRPSLEGWTPEQAWLARPTLDVDRRALRADVDTCTRGLVTAGVELLRARRIAIESALQERKLLTINQGGWR
jgi:transposase InsO family protein